MSGYDQELRDVSKALADQLRFDLMSKVQLFSDMDQKKMIAVASLVDVSGMVAGIVAASSGLKKDDYHPIDLAIEILKMAKQPQ